MSTQNQSVKTPLVLAVDFEQIRICFAREIQKCTGLSQNSVVLSEPESQNNPRPVNPYMSMKIINPGAKFGDDTKYQTFDAQGNLTDVVGSGGVRKMTVSFQSYGTSHEEAYNYMATWQTALDLEDIQADLRTYGIAVWTIGNVDDISQLLNTGYEGRAVMTCTFGIAMNLSSNLGEMDTAVVDGAITTDQGTVVDTSQTVTN